MGKKATVSLFHGGGPAKDESGKKPGQAPLCGDPLDDLRAQLVAKAEEAGYSKEEIKRRLGKEPYLAEVVLTGSDITVDGYKLERLNSSVRAFYILVARHPEGIEKKEDPRGLLKGSFQERYEEEYKAIFNSLTSIRKKRATISLDARFQRYRDDVNKAIKSVEEAHGNLDLSSCKVVGTQCWKISARVVDLTDMTGVPEL